MRDHERTLAELADLMRAPVNSVVQKARALVDERRALEKKVEGLRAGSAPGSDGGALSQLLESAATVHGARVVVHPVSLPDVKELHALGDTLRERLKTGAAVLAASLADGKHVLLVVVTDDLRDRGVRADALVREIAALAGGKGGGKPHMAQAGIPDASRTNEMLAGAASIVRAALAANP
jgi:alanyl-tRNA synthetase